MTDTVEEVTEIEQTDDVATLKQQLAEAQKAINALASKKDELLKETKAAKDEKRRLAEQSKTEQETFAQKNGEYEKLFRQRDEEYKKLEQQITQQAQERRKEKIDLIATKVAVDLAKGDANKAELLSVFVSQNLQAIADEVGNVDNDTLTSVKKQFEADAKYQPLLGGNLSAGGSAPGNTRGASVNQKMNRAEFDQMPAYKKSEFIAKVQQGKAQLTD